VNTGLFSYNSVRELNTKNMGNSSGFLSVTHTILFAKQFRSYRFSKIDFAADFCFWTEQRLKGTQLLGLRLAETLNVPNTIRVGNSLSFRMVHNTAPIG
jgi:predicted phosphoadenosine phosphosulfate sulfurtransferase